MKKEYVLKKINHVINELRGMSPEISCVDNSQFQNVKFSGEIVATLRNYEGFRYMLSDESITDIDARIVYHVFHSLAIFLQNNSYYLGYRKYGYACSLKRVKLFMCWYKKFMNKVENVVLTKEQRKRGVDLYFDNMQIDYKF